MKTPRVLVASIASLAFASAPAVYSQTWDGGGAAGGNLDWITATNWVGDAAPANNGTANVIFAGTVDNNPGPNLDQNWNVNSLTFNNTAGAFVLGSSLGFTLTIQGGGLTNNDTQAQTINHAIALGAAQTWTGVAGAMVINGAVNNGGNLLSLAGGSSIQISGQISGTGGLTVSSGGTHTLSGTLANTYTGTTTINGGTLVLQKTATVAAVSNNVVIGDGVGTDTVQLGANEQIAVGSTVTVNSSGVLNLANFNEGFLVLNVNGGSVTTGTGTLNISTSISMTGGSIATTGAGQILLNGNLVTNAAAGAATISGDLNLNGPIRTFTVANGAAANDLDISADITNGGINKLGAGTLRLTGNNTFNGGLNVTAGTVALGSSSSAGTNTIALSGGTLASDGVAVAVSNAITFNGNSAATDILLNGAMTLIGNRTLTVNPGTVSIGGVISGDVTTNTFTKSGAGDLVFNGSSANTYTGVTIVNDGILRLSSSAVAIAGDLAIGNGAGSDTVQVGNFNEQIANTSSVTVNSGGVLTFFGGVPVTETVGALTVNAGGVVNWNGTLGVSSVQLTGTGTIGGVPGTTLTLNGNVTTVADGGSQSTITTFTNLGGASRTFTIGDGTGQFDASVAGLTNGVLVKEGAGGLLLAGGASNFAVTLNSGLIAAVGNNSFGNGTLTLNGGTIMASGASLSFPNAVAIGGDVTFGGTTQTTYGGAVTLGNAAHNLSITNTSATIFSGAIGQGVGGAALTKSGTGVVRFEGSSANTYTGVTTIADGTLILNKSGGATAIAGNLVIGDGSGSDVVQFLQNNQIADTSSVTVNTGGTFDLVGATDTIGALSMAFDATVGLGSGSLTVGAGGLQISGGTVSGTGTLTLAGNVLSPASNVGIGVIFSSVNLAGGTRTFDVRNGTAAFEVDLTGSVAGGTLVKAGDGILRLSGAAANGGTLSVIVTEGELRLQKSTANAAITGPLTIGDGIGGTNADVVRLAAPEQISTAGSLVVTIERSGLLDLNNFNESIANLELSGGNVTTGTGVLSFVAGSNTGIVSNASPTTATINGNLNLGGQTKVFDIASGGLAFDVDIPALISNGGINKTGPGVLRLSGNNTFANGLFIDAGTVALGSDTGAGTGFISIGNGTLRADGGPRTIAIPVGVSGTASIDGAENLTLTTDLTLFDNGRLTKSGTGTLTLGGNAGILGELTLSGGTLVATGTKIIQAGASFTQNGGTTYSGGTLVNQGTFTFNGGAFNATLQNEGVFTINLGFLAQTGITNFSTINVTPAGSLNASGPGIANEGTIVLSGGTLQLTGTGAVVNNGAITGFGTIDGTGGFTNNAQVTVSGGNLTLDNSGSQSNAGNIEVPTGRQLRLNNPLGNTGTVALAGGTIGSSATLTNNPGGTISGRGTVTAPLANTGGTLRAEGGTLNITSAFTSSGIIRLEDGAGLAGGTIASTGRIQGDGSIANAIINSGRIEAQGTLALGGTVTQNVAGTIAAGSGSTALFSSGLANNAGTISLNGGTFDNNGFALNNTGQISGFGVISTGGAGLTNNGSVTFTGGFTTVNGNVTNAATKRIETVGDATLFTGNVVNNGTFKNTDGRFTFAGTYTENGTFISDPADNYFTELAVSASGTLVGGLGDRFFVSGNFLNGSAQGAGWTTGAAELSFHGGPSHVMTLPGVDLGQSYAGYTNNFSWGVLRLEMGQSLSLGDGNGTPGAAFYAGVVDLAGGLAQISAIVGNGFNIYYDPLAVPNAYLGNQTYTFQNGGALVPVPEPGAVGLLLVGLAGMGLGRFRKRCETMA